MAERISCLHCDSCATNYPAIQFFKACPNCKNATLPRTWGTPDISYWEAGEMIEEWYEKQHVAKYRRAQERRAERDANRKIIDFELYYWDKCLEKGLDHALNGQEE